MYSAAYATGELVKINTAKGEIKNIYLKFGNYTVGKIGITLLLENCQIISFILGHLLFAASSNWCMGTEWK